MSVTAVTSLPFKGFLPLRRHQQTPITPRPARPNRGVSAKCRLLRMTNLQIECSAPAVQRPGEAKSPTRKLFLSIRHQNQARRLPPQMSFEARQKWLPKIRHSVLSKTIAKCLEIRSTIQPFPEELTCRLCIRKAGGERPPALATLVNAANLPVIPCRTGS